MAATDADGVLLDVNDAYCELLDYPRSALLGHNVIEFTHPDDLSKTQATLDTLVKGSAWTCSLDKHLVRSDGVVVPVRVATGWAAAFDCLVGVITDLSDLRQARDQMDAARARQAALLRYSSSLIFVVDRDGRFRDVNPATERLFGSHVGEDAVAVLTERVHLDDRARALDALRRAIAQPGQHESVTFRVRADDGRWVHLEAAGNNQFDDPAVTGMIINALDVTERETHSEQIQANLKSLLATLGRASEIRDPYTGGHQDRVGKIAAHIALDMQLPPHQIEGVQLAAQVHDIGKLAIPAEILAYPGKTSPEVFTLIKTHCQIGHDILADIPFPWPIAQTVLQHHERLDGSGYPNALHGDDILLEARIVAVADVAEAMTSHRPYRPALGIDAALNELRQGRGTKYDPAAVDAYLATV